MIEKIKFKNGSEILFKTYEAGEQLGPDMIVTTPAIYRIYEVWDLWMRARVMGLKDGYQKARMYRHLLKSLFRRGAKSK